ncbi:MAG: PQQ-binding-like beta-propeller repeat protein, partial [Fuerstiella sp.]
SIFAASSRGLIVKTFLLTFTALVLASSVSVLADNWPHWRGIGGNGVASNASPPTEWSDTKNVKWKVRIPGRGSGSPVIWEDRVFVTTAVPAAGDQSEAAAANPGQGRNRGGRGGSQLQNLQFKVMCFNRKDGKLLWEKIATEALPHQETHSTNGFASASPCTDGEHVYAHFGSRGLYCYTMDGTLVWERNDLGQMETRNSFGEGSSPTLADDKIIVPWDHEGQSSIFALNKLTGKTIWKTNRDEPTCWATPLVIEHDGQQQVIMNGQTCARSYDLETGKELWRCGGQTERPVACPVAADGLVFVGSGHRGSFLAAFRPDGKGDIEGTQHVVWTTNRDTPDIASLLLSSGRLYFHKGKTGILTCVDAATGKPHFEASRVSGLNSLYASPIAAGGYIFSTDRSGTTVVIKDSDKLEIVATNSVGETVDATPAPVDNELFIRGEQHLFCISK